MPELAKDLRGWRARLGPLLLCGACFLLFALPVLDPRVQLFDRDTGRCEYAFKAFMAAQLRRGELPLWAPFTEAGTSLLGQMTPALFHPFTLLYLAAPFELAFKLNHLLALPLAGLGAFLLARRLGASRWAATASAVAYGGSGWVVSMAASNLHYALGAAAVPLALAGLHALLESPTAARLLWGAAALASTVLAGDPQSALTCALFGGGGALLLCIRKRAPRALGLWAAWGLCGALLAGPALLPAMSQARRSARASGPGDYESRVFRVPPVRLAGLLLPFAFDDQSEQLTPLQGRPPYFAYFADPPYTTMPFATSIALGAPALLLAAFALRRRGGRFLLGGAALFALASLGGALPVERMLHAVVPPLGLFRYAEKQLAPATLLLSLAAALGLDLALARPRALARASGLCGAALLAAAGALGLFRSSALAAMLARAPLHQEATARLFVDSLGAALALEGTLLLAIAAIALLAMRGRAGSAGALAACACAAAALLQARGVLFTAPIDFFHGPFALAATLLDKAGPSEGRWRIDADPSAALALSDDLDWRLGFAYWESRSLATQYNALAKVESVAVYSALEDGDYLRAWHAAPGAMSSLLGVRFSLRSPGALSPAEAARLGYSRTPLLQWVREEPPQPRAFLVGRARVGRDPAAMADPAFDPHAEALLTSGPGLSFERPPGAARLTRPPGAARLTRPSPRQMLIEVEAATPALLVIAEHFDPGWRATLDGREAAVEVADLVAPAVRVAQGKHRIELRYWPVGLTAGLWLSLITLLLLAFAGARKGAQH